MWVCACEWVWVSVGKCKCMCGCACVRVDVSVGVCTCGCKCGCGWEGYVWGVRVCLFFVEKCVYIFLSAIGTQVCVHAWVYLNYACAPLTAA